MRGLILAILLCLVQGAAWLHLCSHLAADGAAVAVSQASVAVGDGDLPAGDDCPICVAWASISPLALAAVAAWATLAAAFAWRGCFAARLRSARPPFARARSPPIWI